MRPAVGACHGMLWATSGRPRLTPTSLSPRWRKSPTPPASRAEVKFLRGFADPRLARRGLNDGARFTGSKIAPGPLSYRLRAGCPWHVRRGRAVSAVRGTSSFRLVPSTRKPVYEAHGSPALKPADMGKHDGATNSSFAAKPALLAEPATRAASGISSHEEVRTLATVLPLTTWDRVT